MSAETEALKLGTAPAGLAAVPLAIASFNDSPHARTLAGLYKTLGTPRASVVPRTNTDREVILTVAWDIVWYQFRIMPDDVEQQSGTYIGELDPRWLSWNCTVAPDGTVSEAGDSRGVSGHMRMNGASDLEGPHR